MLKIVPLPVVHKANVLKIAGGGEASSDYEFIPLPLTVSRFFQKLKGFWFEIGVGPDQICYDESGLPHLAIRRGDKEDLEFGITLASEDKQNDGDETTAENG